MDIVAEPQEADPTTLLSGRTLEALAGTFFLQDASLPQLARVLSACEHRTVRAGETLVAAGSESDGLIVVLTGELQLQDGADRRLHPGDVSGASHLAWPRPARGSLGAIKDSEVLVLRAERFHKLTLARPRLGVRLLERLAGHLGARLAESTDGAS